jgi:flagellar biogenesis protein FliO
MRHKVQRLAGLQGKNRSSLSIRGLLIISMTILALGICAGSGSATEKKNNGSKDIAPRQVTDFTAKKTEEGQSPSAADPLEQKADPTKKTETNLYSYDIPEAEETSYGWLFFKTVIILALFGMGFFFFLRYVTRKSGMMSVGSGVANILSVVPIGQNKFIHIVDIGGRMLVLGVTDNSISLITELKDRDEIERVRLQSSKTIPVQHHGFQDFVAESAGSLFEFIGRAKKGLEKKKQKKQEPKVEEYIDDDRVDYLRNQRERLRRLNGHNGDDNGR